MKVGDDIIGNNSVQRMWPAYFEAQSSLDGPKDPKQLLQMINGATPFNVGAEGCMTEPIPAINIAEPAGPYADDLVEAHQGYHDE